MHYTWVQKSFAKDATLSQRLFDLLETTFPGISQTAQSARNLGAAWESVSTPFLCFQDEQAIAHVGVLELPLWIRGQATTVGGIHGVCTHPQFRRRGYFRQCMTAALDYCACRYDTLVLTTAQPELYQPFGFRIVEEHAFIAHCTSSSYASRFRRLNLQAPGDRQILHRLLSEREAVSNILGVVKEKAVFCFNEGSHPLHYAEDLDLIVVMEVENTRLQLFDIVWKQPCRLADICDRISQPINEVVFYFSYDRLDVEAQPFPHVLDGDSYLMARGPFAVESQAFMLPYPARC